MAMTLNQCHPEFVASIEALGRKYGKATDEVYAMWRKYSDACYDQSAILWEFEEWHLKAKAGAAR
jgi:citrate synthase